MIYLANKSYVARYMMLVIVFINKISRAANQSQKLIMTFHSSLKRIYTGNIKGGSMSRFLKKQKDSV